MQAEINNGEPRRDFVEYDHPDGLYTVEAHRVTKTTEGEVTVPGGGVELAREGDVLIRRGNVYEVHKGDVFDGFGLEAQRDQRDLDPFVTDEAPVVLYDPNEHTAAEVRRYLRSDITDEERARVEDAEHGGQNRASAFPRR